MSFTPAFKRLWAENIFTNLADGLASSAFPLLAVTLTRDPVLISLIGALTMLPWLLFAMPIGAVVDVVNKKMALAIANIGRAILAAFLTVMIATDLITIYWLLAIAFLVGICEVLADTTSQTIMPLIVSNEDRVKANSRLEMTFTVIQSFIGAPIGALIYTVAMILPFISNAIAYGFAALICLTIPLHHVRQDKKIKFQSVTEDVKFGIRYLFAHATLRRIVIATTLIGFCASFARATEILFWLDDLRLDPKKLGLLISAMGVVALLSAALAPKTAQILGYGRTLSLGITLTAVSTFLAGFSPNIWWFLIPGAITVFAITQWNIVLMATYQRLIPHELYGRIHGTRRSLIWGTMPFAALLGGLVAKIDLRLPWYIGGALMIVITFANWNFIIRMGDGDGATKVN